MNRNRRETRNRNRRETHPALRSRLKFVEERVDRTRERLERQVDRALVPLDIQEDVGISRIKGEVLIVSDKDHIQDKVRYILESEGYRCDIAENSDEAIGFLKLGTYRMVIIDRTGRRRRARLNFHIRRYMNHIKIISIVRDEARARESMQWGAYSFVMGENFDPDQLSTCLMSSLQMDHRVCDLLAHGEPCNRSCIDNYEPEDDFDDLEFADEKFANPDFVPPDVLQEEEPEQADFFEELQEIETHRNPNEDWEDEPG